MRPTPRMYRQHDHLLRAGDYLRVAADRFAPDGRRLDEAFTRIERVEHLTGAVDRTRVPRSDLHRQMGGTVVFGHGMPGPVILRRGDHRVLEEVNPARAAADDEHPWWTGAGPQPLFRDAVMPGSLPPQVRRTGGTPDSGRAPVVWPSAEPVEPARRRAASFTKPARALRVGDYMQVLAVRFPERDRDTDEGFHRVEWVGYLDADYSARLLCDAEWAASPVTVVVVHGLSGALLLPDHEVRVMVWPNPERAAWERQQIWQGQPMVALAGLREPTEAEHAEADRLDEQLRPAPPAGEADLYPVTFPDAHERAMLFDGVDGIRSVSLAALPWPHRLSKCEHLKRIEAAVRTYPDDDDATDDAGQAATAEVFGELTAADFAACRYHQAAWAAIGAIALELTESGKSDWEALEQIDREQRLSGEDRKWLRSLFQDPICWDDGDASLVNGQHRLCALRAAGVSSCPIDGRHLPDAAYPAPLGPAEHARRTVEQFWISYLTARFGGHLLVRCTARLFARDRRLRDWLPGAKREYY
ncbi:MAG: hypothetical protein ACRDR6_22785 [Pseudonocardiaceae bacterium]